MSYIGKKFVLFACTKVDCKNYDIDISIDEDDCLKIKCNECGCWERVKLPENSSLLKYKRMWTDMRAFIEGQLSYHKSGEMQSIAESIQGEVQCESFLNKMNQIEDTYTLQ